MAINPVSNITQMIEALRREMGVVRQPPEPGATGQVARQTSASGALRMDMGTLEKKIRARVLKLSSRADRSPQAPVRVFIEAVLLWEFGDELTQDPRFHQMLDEITARICENADLADKFQRLFSSMSSTQK